MQQASQLKQDLEYVAGAVRRQNRSMGVPAIYFLWAVIVAVGWALPDFAPQMAAPYWIVCGIGGGLVSMWLAGRDHQRSGTIDRELGRRHGLHWLVTGVGFMICWLPVLQGAPIESAVGNFILVAGLSYALAGVHLERPLLWTGLLMLAAYLVLNLFALPYTWTVSGLVVGAALAWAGYSSQRSRLPVAEE